MKLKKSDYGLKLLTEKAKKSYNFKYSSSLETALYVKEKVAKHIRKNPYIVRTILEDEILKEQYIKETALMDMIDKLMIKTTNEDDVVTRCIEPIPINMIFREGIERDNAIELFEASFYDKRSIEFDISEKRIDFDKMTSHVKLFKINKNYKIGKLICKNLALDENSKCIDYLTKIKFDLAYPATLVLNHRNFEVICYTHTTYNDNLDIVDMRLSIIEFRLYRQPTPITVPSISRLFYFPQGDIKTK